MAKAKRAAATETKAREARRSRAWGGTCWARSDKGGVYYLKFTGADGKTVVRSAQTKDRAEAERLLAKLTGETAADVERGVRRVTARSFCTAEFLPLLRARVAADHAENVASHLLGSFPELPESASLEQRAARRKLLSKGTAEERDEIRRGGFCGFIGDLPLYEVGTDKVELYLSRLRTGEGAVSPATVQRQAASLSGFFRAALDAGVVRDNPVRRARLPKVQQFEPHAMTPADVDRVIARVPDHARTAFVLLADLGLRLGELLALTWQHVAEDGSQVAIVGTKSGRTRAVPVPARARALLVSLRKARIAPMSGTDHVLAKPRSKSRLQRLFREAAKGAGLPVTPDSPVGVRIHDIRHAYASALARNGVPLSVIAALIGDSMQVTSSRYARHVPASAAVLAVATLDRPGSTASAAPAAPAARAG